METISTQLVRTPDGVVYCVYMEDKKLLWMKSNDDGLSWSNPSIILEDVEITSMSLYIKDGRPIVLYSYPILEHLDLEQYEIIVRKFLEDLGQLRY